MTKKSSKKSSRQAQETTVAEEQKPSPAHKKQGSEIDEIFAGKKRKKSEAKKTETSQYVAKKPKKSKKNVRKKSKGSAGVGDFPDPPSGPRKTTEDGLAIYTEEELGINKAEAGTTPLCPFDCSCCF
ncbi:uncharacterized protein C6G9.01c-like [Prosopis cineraria]|uniref:uncharacterized protein C6G9.01c-like n=1 Tax=Prosopis cineraria TaxID=364024 RepID=UPI00240EFE23|nr:uncharacterized protein C6G9.01c-like [Prosopis cineraria]XP_054784850.1 uncharacterized protein C6G9.01c-like [Prosopis cineraria]